MYKNDKKLKPVLFNHPKPLAGDIAYEKREAAKLLKLGSYSKKPTKKRTPVSESVWEQENDEFLSRDK